MARMYSNGHGKSQSITPYTLLPPTHCSLKENEVIELIVDLGRKGKNSCAIGNILRDEHGIGKQYSITHKKMGSILKQHNAMSKIPEDVVAIEKKCLAIYNHIKKYWNDKKARYRLQHAASLMHRIIRYYKGKGIIEKSYKPASFKLDKKFKL